MSKVTFSTPSSLLNKANKTNTHSSHIDFLRLTACLMVVFMHAPHPASAEGNGLFLSTLSYFTAPCIGLFFMVSGTLLLPLRTDTPTFLKKRFGKVLFPTLLWSLFYLAANACIRGEQTDWLKALVSLPFSTQGNPVLWFMYTLMGLYLLAPILSRWLENAQRKELEFYLALWGISLCYPLLSLFADCNTSDTGVLYYFTGYAGYFVLGHYLKKYPERLSAKIWAPLLLIAVTAPIVCKLCQWEVDFYSLFWYLSIFVAIQCISWYQAITHLFGRVPIGGHTKKILTRLSSLSFGIYLVHIFIMRYLLWNCEYLRGLQPYALQTGAIALLTFVLSAIVCWLISLLPGAQYIIGYKKTL